MKKYFFVFLYCCFSLAYSQPHGWEGATFLTTKEDIEREHVLDGRMETIVGKNGTIIVATKSSGNGIVRRRTLVYRQGINVANKWHLVATIWTVDTLIAPKLIQIEKVEHLTFVSLNNVEVARFNTQLFFLKEDN